MFQPSPPQVTQAQRLTMTSSKSTKPAWKLRKSETIAWECMAHGRVIVGAGRCDAMIGQSAFEMRGLVKGEFSSCLLSLSLPSLLSCKPSRLSSSITGQAEGCLKWRWTEEDTRSTLGYSENPEWHYSAKWNWAVSWEEAVNIQSATAAVPEQMYSQLIDLNAERWL